MAKKMESKFECLPESIAFEQFINKRISNVYRSCNRYWKKKYDALVGELEKVKENLAVTTMELNFQETKLQGYKERHERHKRERQERHQKKKKNY